MEARYRGLVDNSGGGLTITCRSSDGKLINVFTSEGMHRLLRTTREQYAALYGSRDVYAKVHPDDLEAAYSVFESLTEEGQHTSAVYRLLCADGGFTWVNVTGRLLFENGGKYIYAVHTDVSEQKEIEQKEHAASEQLSFLNRVAGDLLSQTDADAAINVVLNDMLEHFDGKRAYVFEFDNERSIAHNTYEVCADGVEPAIKLLESVPFSVFSEWFMLFERDGFIAISDISALGEDRATERALLEAQQIDTLVVVPLKEGGRLIGMMGVDDPSQNADQMNHLQAIGDYMSVMLSRRDLVSELNDNNCRMEVMMNDTPGGFAQMVIHPDGSITPCFVNDGFSRLLSMTRDEALELFRTDAYAGAHPDDREHIARLLAMSLDNRQVFTTRVRFLTGSGGYIPVEAYYRVWEKSRNEFYLNGYYRDISEVVALEENYKRNLAYRAVTVKNAIGSFHMNMTRNTVDDGISDDPAILQLNIDGTMDGFFRRVEPMLESPEAFAAYCSCFSREELLRAFDHGRSQVTHEHAFTPTPERALWIRTMVNMFINPQTGDVEGFLYARDITEEHMLSLLMGAVVNIGYDFIVSIELRTNTYRTFLSNADIVTAFKDNGMYDDETISNLIEIIHPDDKAFAFSSFQLSSLVDALQAHKHFEFRYRVVINNDVHYKKCACAYIDDDRRYIVICRTDETSTVLDMQAALDAAQKASAAKSEFLSHMSHEIRTPMNAIIGMTQLAVDAVEEDTAAATGYLGEIHDSSQYLLSIINDILDMSRIESGKFTLNCKWVTLAEILTPCLEIIRPAIDKKGITLEMPLDGTLKKIDLYECYLDPMKIQQMLLNLLNNACKFTGEGGRISIKAKNIKHDSQYAVDQLIIEDTGCGMSEEFLEHIFQPFEQEKNIYSSSVQGTGLGLAIAHRIALAMGGNITAESKLGVGSKFTITIPYCYRLATEKAKIMTAKTYGDNLSGAHILLAEDNDINAKIAQKLLEKRGVHVTWVKDGAQAISTFADSAPGAFDAILMDIRMPKLDGLASARAIRALERDDAKTIPILAMSANAFTEDVQKSLDAGMNAHLAKPVDPEKLYETLSKQITRAGGN